MNKTIIINIGGTIFHIEEDAYDLLKNYMTEVKKSLNNSSDSFEIITDIENRFAELFSHFLITQSKQVIVAEDVKVVMDQMGKPSDFNLSDLNHEEESIPNEPPVRRRLFRDPDDKIIGGVCSGISHYFDIDPVWVRLVLGFSFFLGGIGLIPYLVFWIAVPAAQTRADRISMKGGVVNLGTIRESVEKDLKDLGTKANQWRKENINADTSSRVKGFFEEIFDLLGKILGGIFKITGGAFGILFLFIGGILLFAFFVAMIALITRIHTDDFMQFPLNVIPVTDQWGVWATVFFLVIIPLIFLVVAGLRIVFKKTHITLPVVQTLAILWFITLGFGVFYTSKIASLFKHRMYVREEVPIQNNAKMTFRLQVNNDISNRDSLENGTIKSKFLLDNKGKNRFHLSIGDDYEYDGYHNLNFSIRKTDSNRVYLDEKFTANGSSTSDALSVAGKTKFLFEQKDTTLFLSKYATYPPKAGFRGQEANIILFVPIGTTLWIDSETQDIIDDLEDSDQEYTYNGRSKDVFIMTNEGMKPKYGTLVVPKEENEN